MKIDELTGYRKHPLYDILTNSTSLREFIENLSASGYRKYLLGKGWYSGVFARPEDNYVIKIFENDPGYTKFLAFIKNNQNNPHVPKLKGKPVNFLTKYTIVRLEKLRSSAAFDDDIVARIRDYVYDYDITSTESRAELNRQWISKTYPQLPEILDSIAQNQNLLDLHSGNIMFRGDVPVITDPYADRSGGGNLRVRQKSSTPYASVHTVHSNTPPQTKAAPADAPKRPAMRRPPPPEAK